MRLELPNDNWADLRGPDEIPRKAARQFRKVLYRLSSAASEETDPQGAARAILTSDTGLDGIEDMADAMVFAVVSAWSYGPVDSPTLDSMPDSAVDAIYQHAVSGGYIEKLMPDFGPNPDDESPTPPLSA